MEQQVLLHMAHVYLCGVVVSRNEGRIFPPQKVYVGCTCYDFQNLFIH